LLPILKGVNAASPDIVREPTETSLYGFDNSRAKSVDVIASAAIFTFRVVSISINIPQGVEQPTKFFRTARLLKLPEEVPCICP
jgi:hypothetical protein